ncbi:uncharacterized protein E5676_scaffold2119G00410 [Cucumis melo var. makuwa]|uniref:Flocculation protein FLO11-like n=1 Tax=Cucumis melo var. makuwa TaxID=1194695 RepID=A0A5D3BWJ2_CUCMM|nr:uncharacterized protein E6C27_scaffold979G00920 [Cucumis melo var. makuwa]TYK04103.1 uncharacterized protein E5676_scaffold2119G00410 [Cucumis melo var. makuwa]
MVNTRKGKYQARSPKVVAEVCDSRTNMHDVRMRGHRFKSTPSRRLYRLPSEKNQVNPSNSPNLSVHDKNVIGIAAENVETKVVVSKSHMSEMDSDERDDVPLARLLKKGLFFKVGSMVADASISLVHSIGSSSSEDIFVPTSSQPSTTSKDTGQSGHSPPVRSPI